MPPDGSVTPRMIEQICALSGLGAPAGVVRRTGGELSAVYEVASPGRAPVIVKVYADRWAWKQAKELHVYGVLEPVVGWAVPEVIDAHDVDNPTGLAYTVLTRTPGRPLRDLSAAMDDAVTADIYRQIGSLAATIHGIAQDAFGYIVTDIVDPLPTNASYVERQFERRLREFREAGGAVDLARDIERRASQATEAVAACRAAVLCHNDLHEGNCLVAEVAGRWRLCGIVDVENAIAADPLLDLAKTDCYSIRGDATKLAALLAGYGLDLPYAEERLALYRIYHTLELWDWFYEVGQHQHLAGLARQLERLIHGSGFSRGAAEAR